MGEKENDKKEEEKMNATAAPKLPTGSIFIKPEYSYLAHLPVPGSEERKEFTKRTKGTRERIKRTKRNELEGMELTWKNSPRLTGKKGVIILDRNNPKHRDFYDDDDDSERG